eukprot:SAG22_NODE_12244_length_450_cov_1.997151_2_plen_69_part_01
MIETFPGHGKTDNPNAIVDTATAYARAWDRVLAECCCFAAAARSAWSFFTFSWKAANSAACFASGLGNR